MKTDPSRAESQRQDLQHQASLRHVHNAHVGPLEALPEDARDLLSEEGHRAAYEEISSWPGYAPTPVVPLDGIARQVGVASVLYKDEASRFTLGSFKALGGAYAVLRVLQDRLAADGIEASAVDLIEGRHRDIVARQTVTCATDGNHGRSVAWGAQLFGCQCRIYIHAHVSADREAAIAAYGATMVRTEGDYDASVRQCARDAARHGWALVADTDTGGGPRRSPVLVMQGYTIMVRELIDQLETAPTHVFIPAGVGGLAAAVAGYWTARAGAQRPRMIVVEPTVADCVFRAIGEGRPIPLEGDVNSFMACLSAGEVSPSAWPVLRQTVDDVLTIADDAAIEAMRALAAGRYGDAPLVSGESGCAGVAAVLALADAPGIREALGIGANSRLLTIGSEGATAPEIFQAVVGQPPEAIGVPSNGQSQERRPGA